LNILKKKEFAYMEKKSLLKKQSKVYFKISKRQLAMAESLLEKEFYEGVMFHCYHALESVLAAGIAQTLHSVPRPHKEKINTFVELYQNLPIINEVKSLSKLLYPHRDRSLYADIELGELTDPTTTYTKEDALDAISKVKEMIKKIERLLKEGNKDA
jgi:HEPN domain-containing protein